MRYATPFLDEFVTLYKGMHGQNDHFSLECFVFEAFVCCPSSNRLLVNLSGK